MGKRERSSSDSSDESSSSSSSSAKKKAEKAKKKSKKEKKDKKAKKEKKEKKEKTEKKKDKGKKEKQPKSKDSADQPRVGDKEKMKRHVMEVAHRRSVAAALDSPASDASGSGGEGAVASGAAKDVVLSAQGGAWRTASMPFGMELDGALVTDLADGSPALAAGVQIGWRAHRLGGGQALPPEEDGAAAKRLRDAELAAAAALDGQSREVHVRFVTEEPEHWRRALQGLQRGQVKKKG